MKFSKRTLISRIVLCLVLVVSGVVSVFPQTVNAQAVEPNSCDKDFYASNDIIFYDPCDTADTCSTGQVSIVGSSEGISNIEVAKTVYEFLTGTALSTNGNKPMTALQASAVLGNFQQESSMRPEVENSIGAVGLGQWLGGRRTALEKKAAEMGTTWQDVKAQMEHLKQELEGSESAVMSDSGFATSQDIAVVTKRWAQVFERMGEWEAHYDQRTAYAASAFAAFGGQVADNGSCTSSSSIVAGDVVKTAISFAVPTPVDDGVNKLSQAKETWPPALRKYNGDFQENDTNMPWTDCGRFVSTSLHASGVDVDFPIVYVPTQWSYVKSHPEKYEIFTNITVDILKPGDILFNGGHITIYTGEPEYPMVDASWTDRVPSLRPMAAVQYMVETANSSGYGMARLKR